MGSDDQNRGFLNWSTDFSIRVKLPGDRSGQTYVLKATETPFIYDLETSSEEKPKYVVSVDDGEKYRLIEHGWDEDMIGKYTSEINFG